MDKSISIYLSYLRFLINLTGFLLATILFGCHLKSGTSHDEQENLPNIVLILSDDMGYSDIGCYGSFIHQ